LLEWWPLFLSLLSPAAPGGERTGAKVLMQ
jgi:hypothetical protein